MNKRYEVIKVQMAGNPLYRVLRTEKRDGKLCPISDAREIIKWLRNSVPFKTFAEVTRLLIEHKLQTEKEDREFQERTKEAGT